MDSILTDFLVETAENIEAIEIGLVTLEKKSDDIEVIKTIFRAMHTIKGTCSMFGFVRLERVSHLTEDLLVKLRERSIAVNADVISVILAAIDVIKEIVAALNETAVEPQGDDSDLLARLKAILGKSEIDTNAKNIEEPSADNIKNIEKIEPEKTSIAKVSESKQTTAEQSLRVNISILDSLMNLVGELVLNRNQLLQLVDADDESPFTNPVVQLNRVTTGLQEAVMKTRMQPIGNAWSKLPRIVRDLEQATKKKLELVMLGQETEIDRQILQAIQDPLIHCVRNSADHGIENPAVRLSLGKPEVGKITLKAYHEGGHIIIEIKDDGAGIKTDIVRNKAVERGLLSKEAAAKLSEAQVQRIIFEPGFSTAQQVTEVSGRGVGMDVVRSNIEAIGGTIDISSREGSGTTIRVKIPLTLAIISALLVRVGEGSGNIFAIPQVGVVELVHISENNRHLVDDIQGAKVLRLREKLLPLIGLGDVLAVGKKSSDDVESKSSEEISLSVVVVQVADVQFGLIVDEVFDTQEIVVKPLGKLLREINLFSGSTILGDGRVVIILDLSRISSQMLPQNEQLDAVEGDVKLRTATTGDRVSMLVFKARDDESHFAVPLALVARLEEFPLGKVEQIDAKKVVQYRDSLLPLIPVSEDISLESCKNGTLPAIIFSDKKHSMGLWVHEFVDIVEEPLKIQTASAKPGYLGGAIVSDRATEIVDAYHFLKQAFSDWFVSGSTGGNRKNNILLVEDSTFFRNLLAPLLESNGYQVIQAEDGKEALDVLKELSDIDLVLSDIEMPNIDGYELVSKIKQNPAWSGIPCIALTTLSAPQYREKGIKLGFKDYMIKFDQQLLLDTIEKTLKTEFASGGMQ